MYLSFYCSGVFIVGESGASSVMGLWKCLKVTRT